MEQSVHRRGMVLPVGVQPERRAVLARKKLRRRHEPPATPDRQVELAADEDVVEVEVVADPRAHRRPVDHHGAPTPNARSEEHTSELQSQSNLVCRLLLEKKKRSKRLLLNCCYDP